MKNKREILCEIIFKDNKLGILTSRIGRIDVSQLTLLSKNSNNFMIFKESYNSPILVSDIYEIIIHQNKKKQTVNKEYSEILKHIKSKNKVKIS